MTSQNDPRMDPAYLKSLSFEERKQIKAKVLAEINAKSEANRKRNARNANRRARYYKLNIADKQCICNTCGLTKTYKEMAMANRRSPKHEDNICHVCLEKEIEIDKILDQIEDDDYVS